METETARCPICEARADLTRPRDGGYGTFSCWDCGCFNISDSAVETVKELSLEARQARLLEAKRTARPGEVPEVTA